MYENYRNLLSLESKPEPGSSSSCLLASSQPLLSQHVLQIFLGLCDFHPRDSGQGHQEHKFSAQSCWSENTERQEREGGCRPQCVKTEERETSGTFPSPPRRQSASSREGKMVETEPNLAQMVNPGQTDKGVKELETLQSGAVSCSEHALDCSLKSNFITNQVTLSGEKPYVCRECG
uniref:Uncharacterized protein n=2 Tax=Rousettus aegyptiacus TaxID=9407 RepID=A0A7J8DHV3_ROUAE|nr:hypothetical protein HJG63_008567 [Rousettus aegyptiacus]